MHHSTIRSNYGTHGDTITASEDHIAWLKLEDQWLGNVFLLDSWEWQEGSFSIVSQ
jgi:hypothetical protein